MTFQLQGFRLHDFCKYARMAPPSESWMREYNEASKLSEELNAMVSEASTLPPTGPQTQRHFSATRRKITILKTKLESLELNLAKLPSMQPITAKEINRRKDLLTNLQSKVNQMANTLNSYSSSYRDRLLGPESKSDDVIKRASNMENQGIVGFQRQIMREQDEGLEKLEETVISTKHIALAVNEELTLHARLLDGLDDHVEETGSRLQRIQRRLAVLNKRTKGGCSCLLLLVVLIVVLIAASFALIKYL